MNRRLVLPVLMGTLVLGAIPALADGNGSTEQQTVRRSCTAPADAHYSAPKANECQKDANGNYVAPSADGQYDSTYYSNTVKCGSTNEETPANPTGVHAYASGDAASQNGGIGVCSDGAVPVHGRISVSGNPQDGATVTADGDNANDAQPVTDKGTGSATVKAGSGGVSVSCGKDYNAGGRGDTDNPDGSQADCG